MRSKALISIFTALSLFLFAGSGFTATQTLTFAVEGMG